MANFDELQRAELCDALRSLLKSRSERGEAGSKKAEGLFKRIDKLMNETPVPEEGLRGVVRDVYRYPVKYWTDAEKDKLTDILGRYSEVSEPMLYDLMAGDGAEDEPEKKHALTLEDVDAYFAAEGIELRFNVLSRQYETGGIDAGDMTTDAYSRLVNAYTRVTPEIIDMYAKRLSRMHSYNPVRERIEGVTWDGVDRVSTLCDAMRIDAGDGLSRVLVQKWLAQAVALALNEKDFGIAGQGVLVLEGPEGIGKSTLTRRLVFNDLDLWTDEDLHIADKDSKMHITSKWIAELSELGKVFRRNDGDAIKRFITAPRDSFRVPYGRQEETHPRRVSFFGTLNPKGNDFRYLSGDDVNRRFWTVIGHFSNGIKLDFEKINTLDMAQLWRQSYDDVMNRGPLAYELTKNESDALAERNKQFAKPLPAEEELRDIIAKADLTDIYGKALYRLGPVTASDIIKDNDSLKRFTIQQIGAAMNKLGFEQDRRRRYNFWRPVYTVTSVYGQAEERAATADEE